MQGRFGWPFGPSVKHFCKHPLGVHDRVAEIAALPYRHTLTFIQPSRRDNNE